jgi:hypothetical protein
MDLNGKPFWLIAGIPLIAIVTVMALGSASDRTNFDYLQLGMTPAQAKAIVAPERRSRRFPRPHFSTAWGDNDTVNLNDRMILTFRGGRLVDKKWIGGDKQ